MVGEDRTRRRRVGTGRRAGFRALLAGASLAALAAAQPLFAADGAVPLQPLAQADAQVRFRIPPQSLADALTAFGQQSGLQVTLDAGVAAGLASPGLDGTMTAEAALRRLLAGTGIAYRFTGPNTVALTRAGGAGTGVPVLDPIRVEGAGETATGPVDGYVATRSATGSKTDTPLIETPQSVSVITRDRMEAQNVQSVQHALRYTAGVSTAGDLFESRREEIYVRGFYQQRTGLYLDGLRLTSTGYAGWRVDPYGLERIEVLRGPSSVLYGQNAPGGIANLVSKRPSDARLREVELSGGSFERKQGAVDIGGRAVAEDGTWLYRVTGLVRDSETQVDFIDDDRYFLAPAATWRPTSKTTLTLLGQFQWDRTGATVGFLPVEGTLQPNPSGKIPSNRFVGEPDFDIYDTDQYLAGYAFEHKAMPWLALRQNFRYGHLGLDYKQVYGGALAADMRTMSRGSLVAYEDIDLFAIDNQAELRFAHQAFEHTLLLGADYQKSMHHVRRGFGTAPSIDVFNPVYGQPVTAPDITRDDDQTIRQIGLYGQDQVKFDRRWILTLGGRFDDASVETDDNIGGGTTKPTDQAFTGRAGLGYLFDSGITPYVSYAESFLPVAGTDFNGEPFEPETGRQYEAGIKYQPPGLNAFMTVAAFDLRQQNVLTSDRDHVGFSIQTGEVRSRGVEVEGVATLSQGLDLIASYTFNDVEVTKSNDDDLGNRPAGLAAHMAALWADYTVPDGPLGGLGGGFGARYTGTSYADTTNTVKVPSHTLLDAALHYDLGEIRDWGRVKLAVNISNLLDKEVISSCAVPWNCYYGARRTIIGTIKYRW